jgi:hypothetical protein
VSKVWCWQGQTRSEDTATVVVVAEVCLLTFTSCFVTRSLATAAHLPYLMLCCLSVGKQQQHLMQAWWHAC